jgi:hypothetical protein
MQLFHTSQYFLLINSPVKGTEVQARQRIGIEKEKNERKESGIRTENKTRRSVFLRVENCE